MESSVKGRVAVSQVGQLKIVSIAAKGMAILD